MDTSFPAFKSKRSIIEGIKTQEQSLLAEIIEQINSNSVPIRQKRTLDSSTASDSNVRKPRNNYINPPASGPKDLHLKANLRYHHQQRHPNGSVIGAYAQMDPSGTLKVTHYVNDEKGFRWVTSATKFLNYKEVWKFFTITELGSRMASIISTMKFVTTALFFNWIKLPIIVIHFMMSGQNFLVGLFAF